LAFHRRFGRGPERAFTAKRFQPFYSSKGASTGLGLSIARVAMRASGGDCRIENIHHEASPDDASQGVVKATSGGAVVTLELRTAPI
jgi:signal transduction histidine kinase